MIVDGAAVVRRAFCEAVRPSQALRVSEWAEADRFLAPEGGAEAGQWRNNRVPHLVEIMDALSADSPVRRVVFMKAAQVGATEGIAGNLIGYTIVHAPCPVLIVFPTVEFGQRWVRQRLDPMLEHNPTIYERLNSNARKAGNAMMQKRFAGGILAVAGANSAAGLRGTTARILIADELDAWPTSIEGEGDPLRAARRSYRSYGARSKELLLSTPTITGRSRIATEYDRSDRRKYHVPCPDCGHMQVLLWDALRWERGPKGEHLPETAHFACRECGVRIEEWQKEWMAQNGQWIPEVPALSDRIRGYHLASFVSLLGWSWQDCAESFLEARKVPSELMVWTNHELAETWADGGDAPEWEKLYARRENYPTGECPDGVHVLTAGVDVQGDRVELEVVGWGPGKESWSIDYVVIPGAFEEVKTRRALSRAINRTYPHASGVDLPIRGVAIDSGHEAVRVYDYVRNRHEPHRVVAVKGKADYPVVVGAPKRTEYKLRTGKSDKRGVRLWIVGTDICKEELYSSLRIEPPAHPDVEGYPPGFCHLPDWPDDWFKQLTSHERVPRFIRGVRQYVFEKPFGRRDEALDCRVYARAAAYLIGVDRWGEETWAEIRSSMGLDSRPAPTKRKGEERRPGFLDRPRGTGGRGRGRGRSRDRSSWLS